MNAVCEHVPYDAGTVLAVSGTRPAGCPIAVRCPCCGLRAWREPGDDLAGDLCPYCGVQSERVEESQ